MMTSVYNNTIIFSNGLLVSHLTLAEPVRPHDSLIRVTVYGSVISYQF